MNFEYGSEAIEHLERRDKRLGDAIDQIGPIHRKTEMGLSAGVVLHITGSQILSAAQVTVWKRLGDKLGVISADMDSPIYPGETAELRHYI